MRVKDVTCLEVIADENFDGTFHGQGCVPWQQLLAKVVKDQILSGYSGDVSRKCAPASRTR